MRAARLLAATCCFLLLQTGCRTLAAPVAAAAPASAVTNVAPAPSATNDIARLIHDLGNDAFKTRQSAANQLESQWRSAFSRLIKAQESDDPEIRATAREIIERVRQREDPAEHVVRANDFREQGQFDDAIEEYSTAITLDPECWEAYSGRGLAWTAKGEHRKGIQDLNRAIEIEASDAELYFYRAQQWCGLSEFGKAIADYSRAIELGPDFWGMYAYRGAAWAEEREYGKALADYRLAIELDPTEPLTYFNRMMTWLELEQYAAALEDCRAVMAMDVESMSVYGYLAHVFFVAGQYGDAYEAYEIALALPPESAGTFNDLAWMQATCPIVSLRDGAAAIVNALCACEETQWTMPHCIDTLAAAYAEAGDFFNAVKFQQKAMDMFGPAGRKDVRYRLELFRNAFPFYDDGLMERLLRAEK